MGVALVVVQVAGQPQAVSRRAEVDALQQTGQRFEATLQVRNKLLSAYKDIMSMPV